MLCKGYEDNPCPSRNYLTKGVRCRGCTVKQNKAIKEGRANPELPLKFVFPEKRGKEDGRK